MFTRRKAISAVCSLMLVMSFLMPSVVGTAFALPDTDLPTVALPSAPVSSWQETQVKVPVPMENTNAPVNLVAVQDPPPAPKEVAKPAVYQPVFGNPVALTGTKASALLLQTYSPYGNYKLSFYCPCYRCNGNNHRKTASGTTLTEGRTVAVDKRTIPLGSKIFIEGFGDFIAEDTGSSIKSNRIDIYVSTHAEALRQGVKYANVYVAK